MHVRAWWKFSVFQSNWRRLPFLRVDPSDQTLRLELLWRSFCLNGLFTGFSSQMGGAPPRLFTGSFQRKTVVVACFDTCAMTRWWCPFFFYGFALIGLRPWVALFSLLTLSYKVCWVLSLLALTHLIIIRWQKKNQPCDWTKKVNGDLRVMHGMKWHRFCIWLFMQ